MWEKRLFFLSSRTTSESPAQLGAKGGQLCLCPCPAAGGTLPFQPIFSVAASFQLQILPSFFVLPLSSPHFSISVVSRSVLVFGFCFFSFLSILPQSSFLLGFSFSLPSPLLPAPPFPLFPFPFLPLPSPPLLSLSPASLSLRFSVYLKPQVSRLCRLPQLGGRKTNPA